MTGQRAREEMIAAFILIAMVANLYFYPQNNSYFYIAETVCNYVLFLIFCREIKLTSHYISNI